MKTKARKGFKHHKPDLILQPGAGIDPLVEAIDNATRTIEILIFRLDRNEVEQALIRAVARGVVVQALIAWTNRGGEQHLRRLEARFLAAGVTVSRTASDLARYHGKMMIVDRQRLYILAFNFTALDIDCSRSFGLIITDPALVKEASEFFEADANRQAYSPVTNKFIVSPLNARQVLAEYLQGAAREILIYDPCLNDPQMVRILEEKAREGVEVKIIGRLKRSSKLLRGFSLASLRLHTRTIVRDGQSVFLGSQSLRAAELDARREVGVIIQDDAIATKISHTFERDWENAGESKDEARPDDTQSLKMARKVAKAMTKELPPVREVIHAISGDAGMKKAKLVGVDMNELEETVREAVKNVVMEKLQDASDRRAA